MIRRKKKQKKKVLQEYSISLTSVNKIIVKMRIEKGEVVKFSVTYLKKEGQKWLKIKRCDNSHPGMVAHCHIFRYNKNNTRVPISGDLSYLLTKSINDFKKHYKSHLAYYFKKT